MFARGIAITNARRAELGLPAIERLGDIHDACAYAIVALPMEFEPDVSDAANVLRIGPVLDAPPLSRQIDDIDIPSGSTPLVLVSLSTSEQGQADLLATLRRRGRAVAGERHCHGRTVDRSHIRDRRHEHAGGEAMPVS